MTVRMFSAPGLMHWRLGIVGILASAGIPSGQAFSFAGGQLRRPLGPSPRTERALCVPPAARALKMNGGEEETVLKVVLFDSTGTLVRLAEAPGETYSRIAKSHGVTCPTPTELDTRFRCAPAVPCQPAKHLCIVCGLTNLFSGM